MSGVNSIVSTRKLTIVRRKTHDKTIVVNRGSAGAPGAPGSVWRNGSGVPSNSLGANGDYYLNTDNGDVYKKSSGIYGIQGNIKGSAGAPGTTFTEVTQVVTLSASDVLAKSISLWFAPLVPGNVKLNPWGGPQQRYGADFTVAATTLSWASLGLDNVLEENDTIELSYLV